MWPWLALGVDAVQPVATDLKKASFFSGRRGIRRSVMPFFMLFVIVVFVVGALVLYPCCYLGYELRNEDYKSTSSAVSKSYISLN